MFHKNNDKPVMKGLMARCFPLMNHFQNFHKIPKIDHNEATVTNSPRTKWHSFRSELMGNESGRRWGEWRESRRK